MTLISLLLSILPSLILIHCSARCLKFTSRFIARWNCSRVGTCKYPISFVMGRCAHPCYFLNGSSFTNSTLSDSILMAHSGCCTES